MDTTRYTYDLVGFLLWWKEVVKAKRIPTIEEEDRIADRFYETEKRLFNNNLKP